MTLAREWGGQKRYISDRPGSRLVDLIGLDAAKALVGIVGRLHYDIPTAANIGDLKARILTHPGDTTEAAKDLGCSERWVREVRNAGLPKLPDREQLVLKQQGTPEQIAAKLGCSLTYVRRVLDRAERYSKVAAKAKRRSAAKVAARNKDAPS